MRSPSKFFLFLLIFMLILPASSLLTRAADHKDSPTADGAPEGDITDFFAFLDPNDATQLVLVMDVNPFAVPAETSSYRFSTNFLYQFKISNDGVAREDFVVQAIFTNDTTCKSGQTISVFGPTRPAVKGARNVVVHGHPAITGCTNTMLTSNSGLNVFAGLRDDPFVFDIGQFFRITTGTQDVFRDLPSTPLGHLRGRSLHSDGTSGVDGFGGFNVTAIAVEFPKSWVQGKTSKLQVWATVSMNQEHHDNDSGRDDGHEGVFQQFQRMGQQVFKTVFIPAADREAFNASVPENDVTNWSSFVPNALTSNDPTGNTIAARFDLLNSLGLFTLPNGAPALLPRNFTNTDPNFVREATLPDVLRLDLSLAPTDLAIGQFGYQNGRRPADAVLDITMRIARQLLDVDFAGSGRKGALQFPLNNLAAADRRVFVVLQGTTFIRPDANIPDVSASGNDRPLLTSFPFLANPHPLPGETTPPPGTVGFPAQQ